MHLEGEQKDANHFSHTGYEDMKQGLSAGLTKVVRVQVMSSQTITSQAERRIKSIKPDTRRDKVVVLYSSCAVSNRLKLTPQNRM